MNAFILAAGLGTRLRPLTKKKPKPLIKVGRFAVLDYVIANLTRNEIFDIGINLHYMPLQMIEHTASLMTYFPEVKLLGTAGALKKAEEFLSDPFVVVNADTITNVDIEDMYCSHKNSGKLITVFTHKDAIRSGGTYIMQKEVLRYIPQRLYSIHEDLIPKLLRKNQVNLYTSDAFYFDIGTPQGLKRARNHFYESRSM